MTQDLNPIEQAWQKGTAKAFERLDQQWTNAAANTRVMWLRQLGESRRVVARKEGLEWLCRQNPSSPALRRVWLHSCLVQARQCLAWAVTHPHERGLYDIVRRSVPWEPDQLQSLLTSAITQSLQPSGKPFWASMSSQLRSGWALEQAEDLMADGAMWPWWVAWRVLVLPAEGGAARLQAGFWRQAGRHSPRDLAFIGTLLACQEGDLGNPALIRATHETLVQLLHHGMSWQVTLDVPTMIEQGRFVHEQQVSDQVAGRHVEKKPGWPFATLNSPRLRWNTRKDFEACFQCTAEACSWQPVRVALTGLMGAGVLDQAVQQVQSDAERLILERGLGDTAAGVSKSRLRL